MIAWREKFVAFGVHFLITLAVAAAAAALVFLVWFPEPFATMVGGTRLFLLIVGCDLALGPLISLVIYDSRKSRGKLLFDYAVVGVVQLAALVYGLHAMAGARPVYIAFVGDRIEVIAAGEIDDADFADARLPAYRSRPLWQAELIATNVPEAEHNDAMFAALDGKDVGVLPKYYVPYDTQTERIRSRAEPLSVLTKRHPAAAALVQEGLQELQLSERSVRWLPVKHRKGFWTALIDASTARPVHYLDVDPY